MHYSRMHGMCGNKVYNYCYSAIASRFIAVCLENMVGDTLSDRGKNQGHITKTQITEIVHALSLAVNVFLNLSAMNFENNSTTLTKSSLSLNA